MQQGLRAFAGNSFFDALWKMRGDAVDQCIWDHLKQDDALLQDSHKDKIINERRKGIDESHSQNSPRCVSHASSTRLMMRNM